MEIRQQCLLTCPELNLTLIDAGVPGVLAVVPDNNFESRNKDYEGLSWVLIF